MIAVKIGTNSWRATESLLAGEVEFRGEPTKTMVWGADVQNLREPNAAEALPAAKAQRIEAVKTERDRREVEYGFPVNFPGIGVVRFHSDLLSRSHLNNLFAGAFKMRVAFQAGDDTPIPGAASNPGWKCMGRDERVPMTVKRCELLDAAAMAHVGALHVAAATHIAAINLLDDPADVSNYDITTGWPA